MFQKSYWERDTLELRRHPTHPVVHAYVNPKIEAIRQYIEISKGTTLLDVGCGNGFFSHYFDQICQTTGVDYSEKMLKQNPISRKHQMDANNLQFKDDSFDIVFCHALLHHVEDMSRVIQEMKRVSKSGVIVLEPNRNNPFMFLFSLLVKEERKALQFSILNLHRLIEGNGLIIKAAFSHGLIVPNKTPQFMVPLLKPFDKIHPLGITNCLIAKKYK